MPKIPVYQQDNRILPDAPPGAEIASGGYTAQALNSVGRDLEKLGTQVALREKEATDKAYASTTALQNSVRMYEYGEELKLKTPPGGDGYTKEMQRFSKDLYDESGKNAPSETARQMFNQKAEADLERTFLKSVQYEREARSVFRAGQRLETATILNQKVAQGAPDDVAYKWRMDHEALVNSVTGTDLSPEQASEELKKFRKEWSDSYYGNLLARDQFNYGKSQLRKKGNVFNEGLDGTEVASWLLRFDSTEAGQMRLNQMLYSDARAQANSLAAIGQFDGRTKQGLIDAGKATSAGPSGKFSSLIKEIDAEAISAVSQMVNEVDGLKDPAQKIAEKSQKIIETLKQKYAGDRDYQAWLSGEGRQAQVLDAIERAGGPVIRQRQDMLRKDPSQIVATDPEVVRAINLFGEPEDQTTPAGDRPSYGGQKVVEARLSAQKRRGVPEEYRKGLLNSGIANIASNFLSAKSPAEKSRVLDELTRYYGNQSQHVLNIVGKEHPSLAGLAVVGFLNGGARTTVLESMSEEATKVLPDIKKNLGSKYTDIKDMVDVLFKDGLKKGLADTRNSIVSGSAERVGLQDLVTDYAVYLSAKMNPIKAARTAYAEVVKKNFIPIQTQNKHFAIFVPGGLANEAAVRHFLQKDVTAEKLKKFGVTNPDVRPDNVFWKSNEALDGFELYYDDGTGEQPKPVMYRTKDGHEEVVGESAELISSLHMEK